MYPTHAGAIICIMLALWPHKYKVGHIDLIYRRHHNLLKLPEHPEFSYVSHLHTLVLPYESICIMYMSRIDLLDIQKWVIIAFVSSLIFCPCIVFFFFGLCFVYKFPPMESVY